MMERDAWSRVRISGPRRTGTVLWLSTAPAPFATGRRVAVRGNGARHHRPERAEDAMPKAAGCCRW